MDLLSSVFGGGDLLKVALHYAGPMAAHAAAEQVLSHMSADGRLKMADRFEAAAQAIREGHWTNAVQPLADQIADIKLPGLPG